MKTKSMIAMVMIMVLINIFMQPVQHILAQNKTYALRTTEEAREYIEKYASEINEKGSEKYIVKNYQYINSFSQNKRYLLFFLSPSGYAVYDEISGVVEEMCLDAANPYKDRTDGELYYGGPMNYIIKKGGKYFIIGQDGPMKEDDILSIKQLELDTVKNRQNTVKGLPQKTELHYMSNSTYYTLLVGDDYPQNNNGTCTIVACTLLLGFFNHYINTNFVPSIYESNYGVNGSLQTYLLTLCSRVTSYGLENAKNGLNYYFWDISFSGPVACFDDGGYEIVFPRVTYNVSNNRPTVIAMYNSPNNGCPYNHTVVTYGYREELIGGVTSSAAYFVHTGWRDVSITTFAWDWFANDIYINY